MTDVFEPTLRSLDERRRAEVVAAFMAVEHAAEPVQEVRLAGLRDPASRGVVARLLHRIGRQLIHTPQGWISGYRDDITDALAAEADTPLPKPQRAVLSLVLIHSVAIPRAEGRLLSDTWLSPYPTSTDELRHRSQLPSGEVDAALRRLRAAGLVTRVKTSDETEGGYVPGPQFHRLTPLAQRRLQEELILAAGPETPLAASVRARHRARDNPQQPHRVTRRDDGDTGVDETEEVGE